MRGGKESTSQISPDLKQKKLCEAIWLWTFENKDITEYLYSCWFLLDINHVFLINDENCDSLLKHPILYNDITRMRKSVKKLDWSWECGGFR